MSSRRGLPCLSVLVVAVATVPALASESGQAIADQVDVAIYRDYLDNELYTHSRNNRGVGRPDHHAARDFIRSELESFGLAVEYQEFLVWGMTGYNVIATQVGINHPDAQYIVGCHYDSAQNPGADDDASGVAAVLEIARVLSQYETEYTVKYITFDAEEYGLVGSQAYVDQHTSDDILGMVQLDMIAWNGYARTGEIYGRDGSAALKTALLSAIDEYGNGLDVQIFGPADGSDHAPFEWAGYQACALTEAVHEDNPCYHRACDTVDTADYIDYEYAADFTRSVAGFLADQAVVIIEPCEGDLDGDRVIGLGDLAILLAHYGTSSGASYEDGDLDGDGDVDLRDLATLLAVYGTSCD